MKREEIEHLKEDEFVTFVEKVLKKIEENKKQFFTGLIILLSLVLLIVLIMFIKHKSVEKDNEIFHKAVVIHNSNKLTITRKIEKLQGLKAKSGLSATINIYLASLYFQLGEIDKSLEVLNNTSTGRFKAAHEQKDLLKAEILFTKNEKQQALDLLNRLLSDSSGKIAKDYLLLKLAIIQKDLKQFDKAQETVNRLQSNYPQSMFLTRAQKILK
jgi:predicted negative regulator of RcsB-dependent stress response